MSGQIMLYFAAVMVVVVFLSASCSGISGSRGPASTTAGRPEVQPQESKREFSKPGGYVSQDSAPASVRVKPGEITGVDLGQLFTMMQSGKILLIDCRPPLYYHMGHIDGAISLPLKSSTKVIESRRQQLDQALAAQKVIVLYCQNLKCPDAYALAKKLSPLGYPLSIYKGGWEEWKQSGL